MMNRYLLVFVMIISYASPSFGQLTCSELSKVRFENIVSQAKKDNLCDESIGNIVKSVGKMFLDTEYVAGTLELNDQEELVVDLESLDCTTFLETVLALSLNIKDEVYGFEDFTNKLRNIRYRSGRIDGYISRLHYFSDWIIDNQKKKNIEYLKFSSVSRNLDKKINFMSTHVSAYPMLKGNIENVRFIEIAERKLNRQNLHFVPKESFHSIEDRIKDGDFIALASTVKGLDISHVGIAVWEEGKLRLLHASLKNGVIISDNSIEAFLKPKRYTGIFVARPL